MNKVKEVIKKNILKKAEMLYENAWQYKVYACKEVDRTTKQRKYHFWIETPDEEFSEMITAPLTKCISKTAFEWLLDYEGDFGRDDIQAVRTAFMQFDKTARIHKVNEKVEIALVYEELIEAAEMAQKNSVITIKDGYCNIAVKAFKELVAELDCEYKALEIKKEFKALGLLRVNSGRAYDYTMVDEDGSPYKVISIKKIESGEGVIVA